MKPQHAVVVELLLYDRGYQRLERIGERARPLQSGYDEVQFFYERSSSSNKLPNTSAYTFAVYTVNKW